MKKDILIGLLVTIGLFIIVEAGLRVFWMVKWPQEPLLSDPNRGWVFTKGNHGHFEINSMGYRDKEIEKNKPKNTYRIICLGDSTTLGFGTETANGDYPAQLRNLVYKNYNTPGKKIKYELINAGISANNSEHILYRLKNEIVQMNPDLIIFWFTWNDVSEYNPGFPVKDKNNIVQKLRNRSYLVRAMLGFVFKVVIPNTEKVSFSFEKKYRIYKDFYPVQYEKNLREIISICKQNKIDMIFMPIAFAGYFPENIQRGIIKYPYFTRNLELYKLLVEIYNSVLEKNIKENNIKFIDVRETVYDKKNNFGRYYVSHCHLNDAGYKIIAETVYKKLVRFGILK